METKETENGYVTTYNSTSAGNLITTAIKEEHNLDIVLYPHTLINEDHHSFARPGMSESEIQDVLNMYPEDGNQDQFMIGIMDGGAIKELIRSRILDSFFLDLEVAGMIYRINSMAGVIQNEYYELINGRHFDEDKYYRVAINQVFFFSGDTFPSYKYRNGLNFSFNEIGKRISARDTLAKYLREVKTINYLNNKRATYTDYELKYDGEHKIYDIQSNRHRSPLWGKKVKTTGIITGLDYIEWYPGGVDILIQDPTGDGRDDTSDAVTIHLTGDTTSEYLPLDADGNPQSLKVGDEITVEATVWEHMSLEESQNMSKTVLRNVTKITRLSENNDLPEPVVIGLDGRQIPLKVLSSWKGDLNFKTFLNLEDGIDFWESLEGMRVLIRRPRVTGFVGGAEDFARQSARTYITLYIRPDGVRSTFMDTNAGGQRENFMAGDYTPEILQMSTGNLTVDSFINTRKYFNVGDVINRDIIGNISFESTIFGSREYSLVVPNESENAPIYKSDVIKRESAIADKQDSSCENVDTWGEIVPTVCRPHSSLRPEGSKLTVASYNLKNLSGNADGTIILLGDRLGEIGKSIRHNLNCPDIVNLVEVQDDNGQDLTGTNDAVGTIQKIIDNTKCNEDGVEYRMVNINPLNHSEGGQPGGNIRVSMIYNANRVKYVEKNIPGDDTISVYNRELRETTVTANGDLSVNPGRVFPRAEAFQRTRKSMVTQFEFMGEKVFVIGNHLNSKLGDSSFWGAQQPPYIRSDERRLQTALLISQFVNILNIKNGGKANVILTGDFNAHFNERSMMALENNGHVTNLMFQDDIVPPQERYTHNYGGESSAIDFIFASENLMKKNPKMDVLHINSDYMGRLSDHDPVIGQFEF